MTLPNIAPVGQRDKNGRFIKGHTTNIGRKPSLSTKRKISNAKKGIVFSAEHRHKISEGLKRYSHTPAGRDFFERKSLSMRGQKRPHSSEHNQHISQAKMGHAVSSSTRRKLSKRLCEFYSSANGHKFRLLLGKINSGPNSPAWQGGISFRPYSANFNKKLKAKIRKRDHYTCQECGYTEKELGYVLHVHHIDYDKKNTAPDNLISLCKSCHAQTNFNRGDWKEYFKTKLCQ